MSFCLFFSLSSLLHIYSNIIFVTEWIPSYSILLSVSISLSLLLCVCLYVCLSVCLSGCLSVCLSVHLKLTLTSFLFFTGYRVDSIITHLIPCLYLFFHVSVYMSICLSVYLFLSNWHNHQFSLSTGYRVDSIIIHPAYDRNSFNADIALLRLKQKVVFTRAIRPVCLPTKGKSFYVINKVFHFLFRFILLS